MEYPRMMKHKKSINPTSCLDVILGLFLLLLCPVVTLSIYRLEFDLPVWMYIVFIIATYRIVVQFSKLQTKKGYKQYSPGDNVETYIVGVTFDNRQSIIQKISVEQEAYLIREPENPHDTNAIKVLVFKHNQEERELLEPKLKEKYGNYSYKEIFDELYEKEIVGYINRDLAQKIAPIFDLYAVKPNQFVSAKVTSITETNEHIKGVRIRFNLPTQNDLDKAIDREIFLKY